MNTIQTAPQKTKRIPLGTSDFRELRETNQCYIDKTLFIRQVIDDPAKVLLLPRPRRFGKTLNLSTLQYFFEQTDEDLSGLFDGLVISRDNIFQEYQGKYPVIAMTFKDLKGLNWENVYDGLRDMISREVYRHIDLWQRDELPGIFRGKLDALLQGTASQREYENSLQILSEQLSRYCGEKVIILIDEYDAPILSGYSNGYYKEIVSFMRNFLSGGLKDNRFLFKGVLTGILRIARESIFSGLNNLVVYTLLEEEFNTSFGFTEEEVRHLLQDFGLTDRFEEVSSWYNGYLFGGNIVYNPWSVLNYIASKNKEPRLYWVNTGDPALIESLITRGGSTLREEVGELIEGEIIEKPVYQNLVITDLAVQDDLLWSVLLFSGYLKPIEHTDYERYCLQIPNREVLMIYRQLIQSWFAKKIESNVLENMLKGLQSGDMILFEHMLRRVVAQIMSYHDLSNKPERVYHALVLGMLVWLSGKYEIRSNRESGYGRYDLMLKPKEEGQPGIIIEFKRVYQDEVPEQVLEQALEQIETKQYVAELDAAGIQNILKLAIAFRGKELWVKQG